MEVTVLEAKNTPKQPVIAFRAGTALRHAEMALNKPFQVALRGSEDRRIQISLYEQLGTQTISDADQAEATCNVPVRTPDGKCSQVKLRVRRGPPSAILMNSKNHNACVKDYLEQHQLEARMQNLFETVLKRQPEDPWRCMIEELHKLRRTGETDSAIQASDLKAPVPPAEPKPANARPSPAAARKLRQGMTQADEEMETKAALAEVRKRGQDDAVEPSAFAKSYSIKNAAQARYNIELAHEVMKIVLRQVLPHLSRDSLSKGSSEKHGARLLAIEHSKARELSVPIRRWVLKAAYNRLEARSLGLLGGGHTDSDYIVPVRDEATLAEHMALTECVKKSCYNQAYWAL